MRSTKGVVTVTKGERKSTEGTKGESGTENVNRQRRKSRGRDGEDGSAEGSGKSARERTRGDDFRERGLRGPPRRGAESPSSPGAAARIFLPLSGPLSRPLFFFSRRAAVAARALLFIPRGPRRFFFSSVCAATPPRHNGRVPENSSLGRRPFPRPPRLFRQLPSRAPPPSSPALPRSPSLLRPFFSPFFFVPATPPPPPAADVDVDPTVRPSSSLACLLHSSASPPGVYFKRSLEPALPPPLLPLTALQRDTFVRCYIRYLRRVMYAPVFGRVFTRPLFDDRLCLMLNETRRSYYRSVYCLTLFRRNVALEPAPRSLRLNIYVRVFQLGLTIVS